MGFPPKLLNEREDLVVDQHPHWLYMWKPIAALVGVIIIDIVLASLMGWNFKGVWWREAVAVILLLALVVALVAFAARWVRWVTTYFVVTTDRVISRDGFFVKRGIEIPLEHVNTVQFYQGPFERIVDAGNLTIESAGETGEGKFEYILRPDNVQRQIYVQMEANENRKYDRLGDRIVGSTQAAQSAPQAAQMPAGPAPTAPSGPSIPEQIEQLARLHQQGVLTTQEFEAKKAELLSRM